MRGLAAQGDLGLELSEAAAWVATLRERLGRQQIEVYGVDPRTRVGRIMVEADYRMKLVGMGLEEGVQGVERYLATIAPPQPGKPQTMDVLRWWFAVNHDAVAATAERDAFELRGQGVQVLSENEFLAAGGQRTATGKTAEPNERFFRLLIAMADHLSSAGAEGVWPAVTYFSLWAVRLGGFLPPLEMTDEERTIAEEMLRTPISGLTARPWTRHTAAGLRRRLLHLIEDHVERKLVTPVYLETL